ncbi:hypothetical protein EDC01DRAFT_610118 [Geopyxis carbonaria]|nr:hypothetical protein EDC01DRAFT_610118 [Geopyxis carbonaria]
MAKFKSIVYNNRGVFLLLVAEFLSSSMGITTRYLETSLPGGRKLHPFHIMWCRMGVTLSCSLLLGWYQGTQFFPFGRKEIRPLLILRSMGGFVGLSGFYFGLAALPLPESTVITFLVPTVVGIACALLPALREPFTNVEKISASVAFCGVILIARPAFLYSTFPWLDDQSENNTAGPSVSPAERAFAVIVALFGVLGAATAYTMIRWIGNRADTLIPVIYFSGFVTFATTICMIFVPSVPMIKWPGDAFEWALILSMSFSGFVMQWTLTRGLQLEKAGRASQMLYCQLLFAIFFEWMVWGDVPKGLSLVGGSLVLASVIFVNTYKSAPLPKPIKKEDEEEQQRALLNPNPEDGCEIS